MLNKYRSFRLIMVVGKILLMGTGTRSLNGVPHLIVIIWNYLTRWDSCSITWQLIVGILCLVYCIGIYSGSQIWMIKGFLFSLSVLFIHLPAFAKYIFRCCYVWRLCVLYLLVQFVVILACIECVNRNWKYRWWIWLFFVLCLWQSGSFVFVYLLVGNSKIWLAYIMTSVSTVTVVICFLPNCGTTSTWVVACCHTCL